MAAWRYYCWNLVATSVAIVVLTAVVNRDGGRLVGATGGRERLYRMVRAASPGVAFGVSLWAAQAQRPRLAQSAPLLIIVQFLLASWFLKPRAAAARHEPAAEA